MRSISFAFAAGVLYAATAFAADDAQFISQDVRTIVAPGSTYPVSITMKNIGDTTWIGTGGTPYKLGSQSPQDTLIWNAPRALLGGSSVAPNDEKTFTFNVTAPTGPAGGSGWPFQYRMVHEGVEWFGAFTDVVYVTVDMGLTLNDCTDHFVGFHNSVGLDEDARYLCYGNQWYDCGDASSASWHAHAVDDETHGRWRCDLPNSTWVRDNDSQFISQHVPVQMEIGRNYTVAITFKNTGFGIWGGSGPTPHRLGSQNPEDNTTWRVGRVDLGSGETVDPEEEKTFSFVITAPTGPGTYDFQFQVVQDGVEWIGDYSNNVAVNVVDTLSPDDCRNIYVGYDDELLSIDDRKVCVDSTWYDCSTEMPEAEWYTRVSDDDVRGSWQCDLSIPRWRYIGEVAVSVDHFPQIAIGRAHVCMTSHDGLLCWGDNDYGQLGIGTLTDSAVPVSPLFLPFSVQAVTAGSAHTCALSNGNVYCWGSNEFGQLGHGYLDSYQPVLVQGIAHATAIAAGDDHTCAIENGALKCWGRNHQGQLGNDSIFQRYAPVISGLDGAMSDSVTAVAAGGAHTCAIWNTLLYCWGEANTNGTNARQLTPYQLTLAEPRQIVAGGSHACALRSDGIYC